VFRVRHGGLVLVELLDGATTDDVRAVTSANFAIDLEAARAS
jgi:acyl CoA:acetate/3-ketoacid CoA transferase beta subunit